MSEFSVFTSRDAWTRIMQAVLTKHIQSVPEFFVKVSKKLCKPAAAEFISRFMYYITSILDKQAEFWNDESSIGYTVTIFAACLLSKFKEIHINDLPMMMIVSLYIAHGHLDDISIHPTMYARKMVICNLELQALLRAFLELIDWRSHITHDEFIIFKNSL